MSRFAFRMIAICSSLFSSDHFSSLAAPPLPPCEALKVSRLALDSTTISRCVSLSVEAIGYICSGTRRGNLGGGHD